MEINRERNTQRSTLLELMTQLIIICTTKHVLKQLDADILTNIQKELMLCLSDTESEEILKVALNSLANLADIMSEENRDKVYCTINQHLHTKLLANVEPVLLAFAKKYPNEVMEKVLNMLLKRELLNADNAGYTIETVCLLVSIPDFTDAALTFTFANIFDTNDSQIQIVALTNLRQLLETNLDDLLLTDLYKNYQLIDKFFNFVNSNINSCILVQISDILRLMVKSLDAAEQTVVIEKYLPKMNLQRIDHLYLTAGLLGYLNENVQLDHFEAIVNELTQLSLSTKDEQIQQICNQLLCSLFNKMPDNEKHNSILRRTITYLETEIKKNNKKAVEVVSWISKGLLARGHSDAAELINTVRIFFFSYIQ